MDQYDEKAAEMLPHVGHCVQFSYDGTHEVDCPAYFIPSVAQSLREAAGEREEMERLLMRALTLCVSPGDGTGHVEVYFKVLEDAQAFHLILAHVKEKYAKETPNA